jgi:ring-1,2-phenylacetyl-CoA epoxidase subunit PaaE
MRLKVLGTTYPTPDSVSFELKKPSDDFIYYAGQHAILKFDINGTSVTRTYSLSSSPGIDENIRITLRVIKEGLVSNHLISARVSEMELESVTGNFIVYPTPEGSRHLIMFAGGSGITPIISMLRIVLHREPTSSVSLVYSNKTHRGIIFKDELRDLQREFGDRLKIYHVITQDENIPGDFPVFFRGRLSKLIIKKLIKGIVANVSDSVEYYLCGPYQFMQLIEETIRSTANGEIKIFKEHFFVPEKQAEFDPTTLPTRDVIIQTKGDEKLIIVQSGKSILQAAIENNIVLPYSCTEGQCGTCRAQLISGEVKLRKNHVLTDADLREGQILLCQGFPASEGVTIKARI